MPVEVNSAIAPAEPVAARGGLLATVRRRPWLLHGLLVLVGTLARIPQLNNSLYELYSFRQTQTAMTAREFLRNGVDLLQSPLPVFGPDANVPMEMPLYQAAVSWIAQTGLGIDEAGRLLSLVFFQISAILLILILRRYAGTISCVVAGVLFQFSPFTLEWGAAHLMEFTAVAFSLAAVLGIDWWLRDGRYWGLVLGGAAFVPAFLVKATTAPVWCLFLIAPAYLMLRELGLARGLIRGAIGVVVGVVPGLIAAVAWTRHADAIKAADPLTEFLTSSALREWNFGTLADRLDPDHWAMISDRISETITGPPLLVGALAVIGLVLAGTLRERVVFAGMFAVILGGPLVFFNLYYIHSYYLSATVAALCAVTGIGAGALARALTSRPARRAGVAAALTAGVLLGTATTASSLSLLRSIVFSAPVPGQSVALAAVSQPGDLVVTAGCDWAPTFLYAADREGVMFRDPAVSREFWAANDIADYSFLLACTGEIDPGDYLPDGVDAVPLRDGVYEISPTTG